MTNNAGFISKHEQEIRASELMKTARVKFNNGDTIITSINGTDEEIREYYGIGKVFNLGNGADDLMASVTSVEIDTE